MPISAIMQGAMSALLTNQTALRVTADNIANVHTPGYGRREVVQQPAMAGNAAAGVEVAEIRRAADRFLDGAARTASADAARYGAMAELYGRIQTMLGAPGGETSLSARVEAVLSSFGTLALDPSAPARQSAALADLNGLVQEVGRLAEGVQDLRAEADQRIADTITVVNAALERVHALNPEIMGAQASGADASGLIEARAQALEDLAGLIDIRVTEQPSGRITVATGDGVALVGERLFALSHSPAGTASAATAFPPITLHAVDSFTGELNPDGRPLSPHIAGGTLGGLLQMRDRVLPDMAAEIGALAAGLSEGLNAIHSDSAAVPPPAELTGRQTGLLGGDAHGFSGKTNFVVADATGALVRRVAVDFDAGTLSIDNGPASAIGGGTITDVVAAVDAAFTGVADLGFSGGVMRFAALGSGRGVAMVQDPAAPSERAGRGFAQVFGLNDLVRASGPSQIATGLKAADAHGFAAGQTMSLRLVGPQGQIAAQATMTVGGSSFGDLLAQLNDPVSGLGAYAGFALDGEGRLDVSTSAGLHVEVVEDNTSRGGTGVGFSALFGLGAQWPADAARALAVRPDIARDPSRLASAQLDLTPTTPPGAMVLARGDGRGALALQALASTDVTFPAAGALGMARATLGTYASDLLARSGLRAAEAEAAESNHKTLASDIDARRAAVAGVNLDEELANMMAYQMAYNAAARLIQTAQQMLDTLLELT